MWSKAYVKDEVIFNIPLEKDAPPAGMPSISLLSEGPLKGVDLIFYRHRIDVRTENGEVQTIWPLDYQIDGSHGGY